MIKKKSSIQKPKWKNLAFKGHIDLSNTHLMLSKRYSVQGCGASQ